MIFCEFLLKNCYCCCCWWRVRTAESKELKCESVGSRADQAGNYARKKTGGKLECIAAAVWRCNAQSKLQNKTFNLLCILWTFNAKKILPARKVKIFTRIYQQLALNILQKISKITLIYWYKWQSWNSPQQSVAITADIIVKSVKFSCRFIFRTFQVNLEPFGANLIAIHGVNCRLSRRWTIVTYKPCFNSNFLFTFSQLL